MPVTSSVKSIAILLSSNLSIKRLLPFAKEAHTRGHKVLFLNMVQENEEELRKYGEVETLRSVDLRHRQDIDVLFTVDSCVNKPQGSKVVSVPHFHSDISPDNTDAENYYAYMSQLAGSDYLILGHKNLHKFKGEDFEYSLSLIPEELHLPETSSNIIPAGYPSLDVLAEQINKHQVKQDCILYASTYDYAQTRHEYQTQIDILETLAHKFPDKEIIFRPLPAALARHDGAAIYEQVTSKNISLDISNSNIEQYARAALLITDTSTTADTFSYATLRPHIQCQMHGFRKELRSKTAGWIVHSQEQLEQVLNSINLEPGFYAEEILRQRDGQFCSVQETAANIIDHIECICTGKPRKGWLNVQRKIDPNLKDLTDAEFLKTIEETPAGARKSYFISCAGFYSTFSERPRSYMDLFNWFRSHQSLSRVNAHNLTCFFIKNGTIRIVDHTDLHNMNAEQATVPFYLNCSHNVTTEDFTLNTDFMRRSFAGYTGAGAEEKGNYHALKDIIAGHDRAYIAIGSDEMYSRMATAFDLYYHARLKGLEIVSPEVLHYTAVKVTGENTVKRMLAWECRKGRESGSFGPFMIWGSSGYYQQLKKNNELPDMKDCLGFIDSNTASQGSKVDGLSVYALPDALRITDEPFAIIIAASYIYHEEILAALKEGLSRKDT
ncbi:hypothetical protein [Maridesulfovibrio sp.]|uniref:hypothetical protein n=1 Tax=Maridesulfovibrio sp. TaxID=2795000 RepID=UPI003B009B49